MNILVLAVTGIALVFVMAFFLLIPLGLTVYSMLAVYSFPAQILKLAAKPLVRRNHALEHATINVLEQEYGFSRLAGFSEEDGFFILGCREPETVEKAAREGLERLKAGEARLAIHKQCGTSAGAANFVMALLFLFSLFVFGPGAIFYLAGAIVLAAFISPYLGELVQEYFTTSTELGKMEIEHLEFRVFNPMKTSRVLESHPFIATKLVVND